MKQRLIKHICILSILANIFVTIPALVLLTLSSDIQYHLYRHILAPVIGRPEIAFIGDSLTRDGGIWAFKIGEYNFNTWTYGHSGLTTRQLRFYGHKVAEARSKYAFIMAGINDEDKSIEGAIASFEDYKEILNTLREAGVEPVIQLTLYRENEPTPEFIDTLNSRLRNYAIEHNLSIIDLNPLLCLNKSLLPKFSKDGVHLTDAAYDVWASEIRKILKMKNS